MHSYAGQKLAGQSNVFCGAYWGWGFHEDGARSAQRVVDQIQVDA